MSLLLQYSRNSVHSSIYTIFFSTKLLPSSIHNIADLSLPRNFSCEILCLSHQKMIYQVGGFEHLQSFSTSLWLLVLFMAVFESFVLVWSFLSCSQEVIFKKVQRIELLNHSIHPPLLTFTNSVASVELLLNLSCTTIIVIWAMFF